MDNTPEAPFQHLGCSSSTRMNACAAEEAVDTCERITCNVSGAHQRRPFPSAAVRLAPQLPPPPPPEGVWVAVTLTVPAGMLKVQGVALGPPLQLAPLTLQLLNV